MIWVPNQLVGAPSGTNVTIDCQTEAHPRAISYWMFNNSMVLSTDKYATDIEENSYRTYMRLTVRNLQAGDFGNYRCISKNSLGETEGSIRLYGKRGPVGYCIIDAAVLGYSSPFVCRPPPRWSGGRVIHCRVLARQRPRKLFHA